IRLTRPGAAGNHIRPAGDDLHPGTEVISPGTVVTPAHVGLLTTVGVDALRVFRRPVVGVLSTGDELVSVGTPLGAHQIFDSNRPQLLAAVTAAGFTAVDLGRVGDDAERIAEAVELGAARCDALITSGGVSMGEHDLVRVVLDRVGAMRWMQVAIKPAKPFAFGSVPGPDRPVPVFGLPGNPVSSLVSFELFARPGLRAMAGHPHPYRREFRAVAASEFRRRSDGKTHFVRVRSSVGEDGTLQVAPSGAQGSHQLSGSAAADALAVLPDGDGVATGGHLTVTFLDGDH
ncbi:MAG: gephyrin-like molybdotransferase Glp, partial [Actinomycetes bacterium]